MAFHLRKCRKKLYKSVLDVRHAWVYQLIKAYLYESGCELANCPSLGILGNRLDKLELDLLRENKQIRFYGKQVAKIDSPEVSAYHENLSSDTCIHDRLWRIWCKTCNEILQFLGQNFPHCLPVLRLYFWRYFLLSLNNNLHRQECYQKLAV